MCRTRSLSLKFKHDAAIVNPCRTNLTQHCCYIVDFQNNTKRLLKNKIGSSNVALQILFVTEGVMIVMVPEKRCLLMR